MAAILIVVVLYAFLRDARAALIAFVAIPLSLLAATLVLEHMGQTLNTMTLGGFAVALGVLVDDAIIGIENILRRLRENQGLPQPQPAPADPPRSIAGGSRPRYLCDRGGYRRVHPGAVDIERTRALRRPPRPGVHTRGVGVTAGRDDGDAGPVCPALARRVGHARAALAGATEGVAAARARANRPPARHDLGGDRYRTGRERRRGAVPGRHLHARFP